MRQHRNFESTEPLVSVVLATFNGQKYIREQIESILKQTHTNIELIIVDDFSTDDTISILKSYAEADERVKIYPATNNLGLVKNFERGVELAQGEFVALSDQDDVFYPAKIETLVAVLQREKSKDLVVSDLRLIDQDGELIADSMWKYQQSKPMTNKPFTRLLLSNFATGCAMMFRRRLLDLALPFPPDILVHDWWLAVVSSSSNAGGIVLMNEPLVDYRQHNSNVIGAKPLQKLSLRTALTAIISPNELGVKVEKTRLGWPKELKRIEGYLSKKDTWNERDLVQLRNIRNLYQGLCLDDKSTLLKRIIKLPFRLSCFVRTKRLRSCVMIVLNTLWPASRLVKKL